MSGLVIDADFRIWQEDEEPIGILNMPYQSLKPMLLKTAARARTRAEWQRDTTNAISISIREIDSDLCQINKDLSDEEQAMVRTAMDARHPREERNGGI